LDRPSEINGNLMSKFLPLKFFKPLLGYLALFNLLFFLPVSIVLSKAMAQETVSRAYVIKAGFVYNFTRFVKWPPQSSSYKEGSKYNICVVGDNPFGPILHRLEEKHRFKEHPLRIILDVSRNDFQGCHILFVGFSERFNVEKIVKQTRGFPILTVGDTEGFAERGIGINLLVVENRVKLEINKQCLDAKRFKVSSELLDLATLVQGGACQ
jgi:YfiR/HmsC-like